MADGRKVTVIERSGGPYDRRLGRILIRPMARMGVHPNHVTFLSLGFGIAAALLFASGDGALVHWAACISMLAVFTASSVEHPAKGGFELEDFIYLIGPITWAGGLLFFFVLYGLGNLGYLAWTIYEFRRNAVRAKEGSSA